MKSSMVYAGLLAAALAGQAAIETEQPHRPYP
jgi:hypothetical protein